MRIREVEVSNFIGKWMWSKGWAGFALPTPFGAVLFYWLPDKYAAPMEYVVRHERAHAAQMERDGWFRFSWQYLWWLLRYGYKNSPYEVAARETEQEHPERLVPRY